MTERILVKQNLLGYSVEKTERLFESLRTASACQRTGPDSEKGLGAGQAAVDGDPLRHQPAGVRDEEGQVPGLVLAQGSSGGRARARRELGADGVSGGCKLHICGGRKLHTRHPVLCQNSALLKDHGCNLMHRKVLVSFCQHLMAEAPMRSV